MMILHIAPRCLTAFLTLAYASAVLATASAVQPAATPAAPPAIADTSAPPAVPATAIAVTPAAAPTTTAPATNAPASSATPPAAPAGASDVAAIFSPDSNPQPPLPASSYRSLLFTQDEVSMISDAASDYLSGAHTQEIAGTIGNAANDLANTLLQRHFYLSSIVYHADNDWVVWMHDQQFTPNDRQHADLRIDSVSKDHAVFTWQPKQLSFYTRRNPRIIHPQISLNAKTATITFSLYPNQTFVPAHMNIEEGSTESMAAKIAPLILPQGMPTLPASTMPNGAALNNAIKELHGTAPLPSAALPDVPTVRMKDSTSNLPPAGLKP